MMNRIVLIATLGLAGCHAPADRVSNQPSAQAEPSTPQPPLPPARNAEKNEAAPPVRPAPEASLPEPKGAIDPKSVEAAGQVVQHFGALVESNRYSEAGSLWGDVDAAGKFTKALRPGTHLEIGDLGPAEGAAGSIYTTVPVIFYGNGYRKPADVILRRVNDVPGSTEAQRRWHIERIEWK
jgi:hypothetical protein